MAKFIEAVGRDDVRDAIIAAMSEARVGVTEKITALLNDYDLLPENAYLDKQGRYEVLRAVNLEDATSEDLRNKKYPFGVQHSECALAKAINDHVKIKNADVISDLPAEVIEKNEQFVTDRFLEENSLPNEAEYVELGKKLYENLGTRNAEKYEEILNENEELLKKAVRQKIKINRKEEAPAQEISTQEAPQEQGDNDKQFSIGKALVAAGATGIALFSGKKKEPEGLDPQEPKPGWFKRNFRTFARLVAAFVAVDLTQSMVRGKPSLTEQGIGKFTDMINRQREVQADRSTGAPNIF